jgi:hypothetical protein
MEKNGLFSRFFDFKSTPTKYKDEIQKTKKKYCGPGEWLRVRKISYYSDEKPKRSREKTDQKTAFADPLSACQAKFYFSK